MTCNNFGVSVNSKESDSSTFLTSQLEKKIGDLKNEIDSKYLDENEADRMYINEPISENIDMKSKKLLIHASQQILLTLRISNILTTVFACFTTSLLKRKHWYIFKI